MQRDIVVIKSFCRSICFLVTYFCPFTEPVPHNCELFVTCDMDNVGYLQIIIIIFFFDADDDWICLCEWKFPRISILIPADFIVQKY